MKKFTCFVMKCNPFNIDDVKNVKFLTYGEKNSSVINHISVTLRDHLIFVQIYKSKQCSDFVCESGFEEAVIRI